MSTTRRTGVAAAAPSGLDAVDAPRITLAKLPDVAARDLRALLADLLIAHRRRPDGMHGSAAGPGHAIRVAYRPRQVAIYVYDAEALATRAAWDAYWQTHTGPDGLPALRDPQALVGAPPRPTHRIDSVAVVGWRELQAWAQRTPRRPVAAVAHTAPPTPSRQIDMFDLLAA